MPEKSLIQFLRMAALRFAEDRCLQIAGSLTFATLLALVPLVTIAVTLISAFPVFSGLSLQVKSFIMTNLVPEASSKIITVYMQQFSENAARLSAVGVVILVVTALAMMFTIERAFNAIWRIRKPRPMMQRLLIFWAVLTVGPLLIGASLSLTSWLVSSSLGLVHRTPSRTLTAFGFIPFLLTSLAFSLVYFLVPRYRGPKRDALVGGMVAGLAFELMKRGFGAYITKFPTYKLVYGTFSTIPIFLLWIYLSWLVVLFGAVIVATLPQWRTGYRETRRVPGARFFDALRVLHALQRARSGSGSLTLAQVCAEARLGWEEAEEILERMARQNWVGKLAGRNAWVLSRDIAAIRVADVSRLFLLAPDAGTLRGINDPALEGLARRLEADNQEILALSLAELFAAPSPGKWDNPA
ncbi:MAG: YihY family inner membrane protein [Pseudomonadota bacterium]